jgi:alcohol dehydrogenase
LRQSVERFRHVDLDVIVAAGGGTCMDTAKAVAALLTNPGDPLDYRGFDKLQRPGVPTVLVPTTAGTGSEVSYNASFVDTASNRKMGVNGRYMFATYSILDGEVTVGCPYKAALSAAVDATVHSLEGFVCKQRTPLSDMLAKKAFTLLTGALPSLKNDPGNTGRRLDLLIGAYLGGIIQMNSGSGVAAAISYPLSVYYKVPHGIGGGMFCLDVIRFNIDAGFLLYSELAPLIGLPASADSPEQSARAVHAALEDIWKFMEVPRKLSAFGIGPEKRNHVLEIMKTQQAAFDQNPVRFTVEEHLPVFLEPYF